jgi:DNA modification methylase
MALSTIRRGGQSKQAGGGHSDLALGVVLNDDRADWRRAFALFPGVVAYVWYGALHAPAVHAALESVKLQTRGQIVWVKQRPVFSRGHYHWQHEVAAVAERAEPMLSHEVDLGAEFAAYAVRKGRAASWGGGRKQSSVWFIEHVKNDTGHSTQKPVECMRRPMLNNSRQDDAVYDPFLGSGTTVIAAETESRVCYGMELDPHYVDVVVRRWQAFTGRAARREHDGAAMPA